MRGRYINVLSAVTAGAENDLPNVSQDKTR